MFLWVKIKKKKGTFSQAVVREMIGRKKDKREDIAGFEGGAREPLAKECGQPPEAGKSKDTDRHLEPPEGTQPHQNLDFSPLTLGQAVELQKCKIINLCCLQPLSL